MSAIDLIIMAIRNDYSVAYDARINMGNDEDFLDELAVYKVDEIYSTRSRGSRNIEISIPVIAKCIHPETNIRYKVTFTPSNYSLSYEEYSTRLYKQIDIDVYEYDEDESSDSD